MKYIIVEQNELLWPVLFPDVLSHADVAEGLRIERARFSSEGCCTVKRRIVSAGFFHRLDGRVQTYGHSDSLHCVPHPKDAAIIEGFLTGGDSGALGAQFGAALTAQTETTNQS